MLSRFFAATGLAAIALASVVATPAHATTLDASGVSLDFSNVGNVDKLPNAASGASVLYTDVATIGGQRVDALVTVGDVSADMIGEDVYTKFSSIETDMLNALNPAEEDDLLPGCYSNAAYVTDVMSSTYLYEYGDFVAADRLPDGRIDVVDESANGSADSAINNEVTICTHYQYGSAASAMEIVIDFQVGGNPVTLTNVVLNVQDVDGGQSVKFSSPKPSSYLLTDGSELEVTDEASFTKFYGDDSADDDPNFAADVHYDSVSSITYEFAFEAGAGGGSLAVMFNAYVAELEGLAPTGANEQAPGALVFFGIALLAAGVVSARRRISVTTK